MTNTASLSAFEIRDETAELCSQGYRLARVVAAPSLGIKLRAEIRFDTYERQSFAAVSVLSSDMRWTHLASEPTASWYAAARRAYRPGKMSDVSIRLALEELADDLVERGVAIMA